jgi:hypothetical protein
MLLSSLRSFVHILALRSLCSGVVAADISYLYLCCLFAVARIPPRA